MSLPARWEEKPLQDVFEINPGPPAAGSFPPSTQVSFVPMGAVDAATGAITRRECREFAAVRGKYTAFQEGDLLLAKITPSFENGKATVARDLLSGLGFGSSEFYVLRPNGDVLAEF